MGIAWPRSPAGTPPAGVMNGEEAIKAGVILPLIRKEELRLGIWTCDAEALYVW